MNKIQVNILVPVQKKRYIEGLETGVVFAAHWLTSAKLFRISPHINNASPGTMHKVDADTQSLAL